MFLLSDQEARRGGEWLRPSRRTRGRKREGGKKDPASTAFEPDSGTWTHSMCCVCPGVAQERIPLLLRKRSCDRGEAKDARRRVVMGRWRCRALEKERGNSLFFVCEKA